MSNNNVGIKCSRWLSTLLTILFVGLKLTNCIDWSWWWVLSPLWIPYALVLLVVLLLFTLNCIINS